MINQRQQWGLHPQKTEPRDLPENPSFLANSRSLVDHGEQRRLYKPKTATGHLIAMPP
jgi:hypothetical protein